MISEVGSLHLGITWSKPEEVNGVLIGYYLGVKIAPPEMDLLKEVFIDAEKDTKHQFDNLYSATNYIVYIRAATGIGRGEAVVIEATTNHLNGRF